MRLQRVRHGCATEQQQGEPGHVLSKVHESRLSIQLGFEDISKFVSYYTGEQAEIQAAAIKALKQFHLFSSTLLSFS